MKNPTKLINIEDLKLVLHIDDETIVNYIEKGMPNYYFEDTMYFNFDEVMNWICSCIDLGFLHNESRSLLAAANYYLEQEDFSFDKLMNILEKQANFLHSPANPVTIHIYYKLKNPSLMSFVKLIKRTFPGLTDKQILSYYLGIACDHYKYSMENDCPKDSLF